VPTGKRKTADAGLSPSMLRGLRFVKTQSTDDLAGFTIASLHCLERRGLIAWLKKNGEPHGVRLTARGARLYAAHFGSAKKRRRKVPAC